jgi:carbonic anhydrase
VSYNSGAGAADWLQGGGQAQLLNSVGSGSATSSISGSSCTVASTAQNSPINIVDKAAATKTAVYDSTLGSLTYAYPVQTTYKVEMNEHTLEVKFDVTGASATPSSTPLSSGLKIPGVGWVPATQLHFHSPSEHTINGLHYPLEMHIVNQPVNISGTTIAGLVPGGVIAIMFGYTPDNTANSFVDSILNSAPSGLTFAQYVTVNATNNQYAAKNNSVETVVTGGSLNLATLIQSADPTTYYTYTGSLTTPGCSQTVLFNVLATPLPVSTTQVQKFTALLAAAQGGISRGADNRAIVPILTGTTVKMSKANIAVVSSASRAVAALATLAAAIVALAL